jgi:hypothetical protein
MSCGVTSEAGGQFPACGDRRARGAAACKQQIGTKECARQARAQPPCQRTHLVDGCQALLHEMRLLGEQLPLLPHALTVLGHLCRRVLLVQPPLPQLHNAVVHAHVAARRAHLSAAVIAVAVVVLPRVAVIEAAVVITARVVASDFKAAARVPPGALDALAGVGGRTDGCVGRGRRSWMQGGIVPHVPHSVQWDETASFKCAAPCLPGTKPLNPATPPGCAAAPHLWKMWVSASTKGCLSCTSASNSATTAARTAARLAASARLASSRCASSSMPAPRSSRSSALAACFSSSTCPCFSDSWGGGGAVARGAGVQGACRGVERLRGACRERAVPAGCCHLHTHIPSAQASAPPHLEQQQLLLVHQQASQGGVEVARDGLALARDNSQFGVKRLTGVFDGLPQRVALQRQPLRCRPRLALL